MEGKPACRGRSRCPTRGTRAITCHTQVVPRPQGTILWLCFCPHRTCVVLASVCLMCSRIRCSPTSSGGGGRRSVACCRVRPPPSFSGVRGKRGGAMRVCSDDVPEAAPRGMGVCPAPFRVTQSYPPPLTEILEVVPWSLVVITPPRFRAPSPEAPSGGESARGEKSGQGTILLPGS